MTKLKSTKKSSSSKKTTVKKSIAKKTTAPKKASKPTKTTKPKSTPKKTAPKKTAPKRTSTRKTVGKKKATTKSKPKSKVEKRDEFRTNKSNGHPSYIYEKVGKSYKYIGITHAKITKNTKNIPLEKNPEPGNKSQAYARPSSQTDKVKKFKKEPLKGWKMSTIDKKRIKPIMK